jgi:hypothetical protein
LEYCGLQKAELPNGALSIYSLGTAKI